MKVAAMPPVGYMNGDGSVLTLGGWHQEKDINILNDSLNSLQSSTLMYWFMFLFV